MIEIRDKRGGLAPVKVYKFDGEDESHVAGNNKYVDDSTVPEYAVTIVQQKKNGDEMSLTSRWWHNVLSFLGRVFLPFGFPATVTKDYIPYQICDTIQNMASSIARTFATEAVFKSLGVGDSSATALAAAMTTLVRNGSRWSAEIFIAWVKGSAFGYNLKKWRLVADFLNDVVLTFELFSPLFSPWTVIYVLAVSSFLLGCVNIAGRSTKVAIAQHQAKVGNIADVSAKENSQAKAINFLSMVVSLVILPMVSGNLVLVRIVFGACIFIHLFANYHRVRSLRMAPLNEARLLSCLKQYFQDKSIPSINKANLSESYIIGFGTSARAVCGMDIRMGVPIYRAFNIKSRKKTTKFHVPTLLEIFDGKRFLILPETKKGYVDVVLEESVSSPDIIEAYFRAAYCAYTIKKCKEESKEVMGKDVDTEWTNFRTSLESEGYELNGFLMRIGEHKAWWTTEPKAVNVFT